MTPQEHIEYAEKILVGASKADDLSSYNGRPDATWFNRAYALANAHAQIAIAQIALERA